MRERNKEGRINKRAHVFKRRVTQTRRESKGVRKERREVLEEEGEEGGIGRGRRGGGYWKRKRHNCMCTSAVPSVSIPMLVLTLFFLLRGMVEDFPREIFPLDLSAHPGGEVIEDRALPPTPPSARGDTCHLCPRICLCLRREWNPSLSDDGEGERE